MSVHRSLGSLSALMHDKYMFDKLLKEPIEGGCMVQILSNDANIFIIYGSFSVHNGNFPQEVFVRSNVSLLQRQPRQGI